MRTQQQTVNNLVTLPQDGMALQENKAMSKIIKLNVDNKWI